MSASNIRLEHDLLGDREVPADAYYGVHTLRALENFPITGTPISHLPGPGQRARLRQAGRRASPTASSACSTTSAPTRSSRACEEIRGGALHDAVRRRRDPGRRRHLDQHERQRGHRQPRARAPRPRRRATTRTCTRNDHVNLSQSTNDVYPTALKLALQLRHPAPARRDGDAARGVRSARPPSSRDVLKMGRTQLQDAVPMTLGQEFSHLRGHAAARTSSRLREAARADPRDQPGRHRDRHRHQRAPGLRRALVARHLAEITGHRRSSPRPT